MQTNRVEKLIFIGLVLVAAVVALWFLWQQQAQILTNPTCPPDVAFCPG